MANIPHITNSTGTKLNRYTMKHADNTEEVVELTFYPSDDYAAGSAYNEAVINPLIDRVNGLHFSNIEVSETPLPLSEYEEWDTQEQYGYYIEITCEGLKSNSKVWDLVADDVLSGKIANVCKTTTDTLTLFTSESTLIEGTILELNTREI